MSCDNEVLGWDQSHLRSVIIYTKSSSSCSMHVLVKRDLLFGLPYIYIQEGKGNFSIKINIILNNEKKFKVGGRCR